MQFYLCILQSRFALWGGHNTDGIDKLHQQLVAIWRRLQPVGCNCKYGCKYGGLVCKERERERHKQARRSRCKLKTGKRIECPVGRPICQV